MTGGHVTTDFSRFSHLDLFVMLHKGNPATARQAAEAWDSTGGKLHDQAGSLEAQLAGFTEGWTGGAANQYKTMISDLADGIRKVADTAFSMRNLIHNAADALDVARAQMPAPVAVPDLSPTTVTLATTPLQVDGNTSPAAIAQLQQQHAGAVAAVQSQQRAVVAANDAHAKAVAVMHALAGDYSSVEDAIPPSPNADNVPAPGAQPTPAGPSGITGRPIISNLAPGAPLPGGPGRPTTLPLPTHPVVPGGPAGLPTQPNTGNPLFGNMFTAGLAAASAAAFGRFGSLMPKVPSWANRKKADDGQANPTGANPSASPKLGEGAGGLGGAGGGKTPSLGGAMSSGGVGGGGVSAGDVPSAAPGMLGNAAGSASGLIGGAAGAAAGAAASGARAMSPMMPMMPMGGMGGGDMGGGRRIPPWLVETENVWGESAIVAPAVLGEE
ncbi:WXG100 family type VII secretion target [Solihabitans fulvus]|uniref:WXG100 family type VII secretion target n=1 Tax=Solihabitans fulvus TaxID=1892852 RepID=A0A5B2XS00_9PSEU|nr:WXG100 family type VII secretion target [Solihabitans fulvus]KAA2266467.1 WXG100 family type VII secretion target [Solihabitans fulvus]